MLQFGGFSLRLTTFAAALKAQNSNFCSEQQEPPHTTITLTCIQVLAQTDPAHVNVALVSEETLVLE